MGKIVYETAPSSEPNSVRYRYAVQYLDNDRWIYCTDFFRWLWQAKRVADSYSEDGYGARVIDTWEEEKQ